MQMSNTHIYAERLVSFGTRQRERDRARRNHFKPPMMIRYAIWLNKTATTSEIFMPPVERSKSLLYVHLSYNMSASPSSFQCLVMPTKAYCILRLTYRSKYFHNKKETKETLIQNQKLTFDFALQPYAACYDTNCWSHLFLYSLNVVWNGSGDSIETLESKLSYS